MVRRLGGTIVVALMLGACNLLVDTSGLSTESSDASITDGATNDAGEGSDSGGASDGSIETGAGGGADVDGGETNPPCEIDSELMLCLRFEGNTKDESSHDAVPATQSNMAYESGRHGQAARFRISAPVNDLTYANTLFSGAKTIELWVKPLSTSRMTLVDVLDDFALIIEGGKLVCRQPELTSTVSMTMNEWNHIACTTDGTTLRAYVNGNAAGMLASTNLADNNGYTGIGQDSTTGSNKFEGWLDDVRIWATTRTAQQIKDSASR